MDIGISPLGQNNLQFEYAISLIDKCTDDYLFYFNLTRDYYCISEGAAKKFNFPGNSFYDASGIIMNIVHEDDRELLNTDIAELKDRKKTEHNLEYRWYDRNGNVVWISCRGVVASLPENNDELLLVGRISEIGANKKADNLTSLKMANRLFLDHSNYIMKHDSFQGCMMMIGIDNFKQLNDMYGENNGDQVLKSLAECINSLKSPETSVYRFEGDGFLLVNYNDKFATHMKTLYNNVRSTITNLSSAMEYKAIYTISAGIIEFTESDAIGKIFRRAEFSLGQAKRNGKNCSYIFDEVTYNAYIRKLDVQERLRQSVNDDFLGFEVFYQPIINPETEEVCGAEALLRWKCEAYQNVYPSEFIPILEESSLIIPVGKWVFRTAIEQCKEWQKYIPDFKMHVNLSYIQIKKSDVMHEIIDCIEENQIDPNSIVFEFTESYQIESDEKIKKLVNSFNERGIEMAIDDFGTGYSNFTYLQNMKVNILKIDRSFVSKALTTDFDFKLIRHVVNMAHNIELTVCLEGVETLDEKQRLDELHPDFIQGYLYGRPVNKTEFEKSFLLKVS